MAQLIALFSAAVLLFASGAAEAAKVNINGQEIGVGEQFYPDPTNAPEERLALTLVEAETSGPRVVFEHSCLFVSSDSDYGICSACPDAKTARFSLTGISNAPGDAAELKTNTCDSTTIYSYRIKETRDDVVFITMDSSLAGGGPSDGNLQ